MKEAVKKIFTQHSREKLLAIILTLTIWTFSISKNSESRNYYLKLNVIHSKEQIVVSDTASQVLVKLTGNVFDFTKIDENDFILNIDISKESPGEIAWFIDTKKIPLAGNLKIEKISPSEVTIKTAIKADKEVKIDPWLDGQPATGFKILNYKVTPEKITITGPSQEIDEIDFITTEKIELSTLEESYEKELKLIFPSKHISTTDSQKATVSITLEKEIKTKTFDNIPIVLDSGEAAEISPQTLTVSIKAPVPLIEKLSKDGFQLFVADNPQKTIFKTKEVYLKDLPEAELLNFDKEIEFKIKK
ncbi:MAG: YbbR-like domain-containing protein [bacterium]